MIEFISTTDSELDKATHAIIQQLQLSFDKYEGFGYYRDTLVTANSGALAELIVYLRILSPDYYSMLFMDDR